MKINNKILIIFLSGISFNTYSMDLMNQYGGQVLNFVINNGEKILKGVGEAAKATADAAIKMAQDAYNYRERQLNGRIAALEVEIAELENWISGSDNTHNLFANKQKQLEAKQAELAECRKKLRDAAEDLENAKKSAREKAGKAADLVLDGIKDQQKAYNDQKMAEAQAKADVMRIAADAAANRELRLQQNQQNNESRERMLKYGLTFGVPLVIATYFGAGVLADYIRTKFRNPQLAQRTSLVGFTERFKNYLLGKKVVHDQVSDVILTADLAQRIATLAQSTKEASKNNTFFRNILFYGPPGTGKTMLATKIALTSGMDYIYFSGSALRTFDLKDGLLKLQELFDFAARSPKKLMIIIDEVENLFKDRNDKKTDEDTKHLLTELLTRFGTESKNYVLVGLTNRPQDLDSAIKTRLSEKIEIPAPSAEQKKQILRKYISDLLVNRPVEEKRKLTFFGKVVYGMGNLFARKPKETPQIVIAEDALSENMLDYITNKTDGWTGRALSQFVISLQVTALTKSDKTLTKQIVLDILDIRIKAEKDMETYGK